jgi:AraC-like DNA-binding protein
VRAAKTLCNDPAFALHYGEAANRADVSVLGLIGNASETMLAAFVQLNRYAQLVAEVDAGTPERFALAWDDGQLWLVDQRKNPEAFPELTEITFAMIVCGAHRFGKMPFVKHVCVTHSDPGYRSEYERILGAPVSFESPRNAMHIDSGWLNHRIALEPRYVFGILTAHANTLLRRARETKTVRARVEGQLMPILHTGTAGMDAVAAKLGLSRTTLLHLLKAEGVSFEKVLDELRRKLALEYLEGRKVSANETAYLLGFPDAAAFAHAFKRWTGTSPRAARTKSD